MNLKHEVNRLSHLFNDGLDKVQETTGDLSHQTRHLAKKGAKIARRRAESGTRRIVSTEEMIMEHVRANPSLYVMGALLLAGALLARLLMQHHEDAPAAPLL